MRQFIEWLKTDWHLKVLALLIFVALIPCVVFALDEMEREDADLRKRQQMIIRLKKIQIRHEDIEELRLHIEKTMEEIRKKEKERRDKDSAFFV